MWEKRSVVYSKGGTEGERVLGCWTNKRVCLWAYMGFLFICVIFVYLSDCYHRRLLCTLCLNYSICGPLSLFSLVGTPSFDLG